jgi:hypothetical protein
MYIYLNLKGINCQIHLVPALRKKVGLRMPLESCAYLWSHPMPVDEKFFAENVLRWKELDEKARKMIDFKVSGPLQLTV